MSQNNDTDFPENGQDNDAGSSPASPPGFKVELDIDDAPFLQEEEEEKAPERPSPPAAASDASAPRAGVGEADNRTWVQKLLADKKRLAIAGGGAAVLLLAPLIFLLLAGGDPPPPPVPEPVRIVAPDTPPREDAPAGPRFTYRADKFLVQQRGTEGELRFLHCRFSIPTDNPSLYGELMAKNIAVRDAIYYYLHNKPLTFLDGPAATQALKRDLISVVNEHISAEKIQDLFIEEYYVTGK